mgnify:CR=1 FL=1
MNRRALIPMALALTVMTVGACGDSPIDPDADDIDRIEPDFAYMAIDAGETRIVNITAYNEDNFPLTADVDFSVCDSKITVVEDTTRTPLNPGSGVMVTGNTLGQSCIDFSAGSADFTTIVRVVPAELELTGPDTIGSGESAPFDLAFLNTTGGTATGFDLSQVTFTAVTPEILAVDATGTVTGKAPGDGQVAVELNSGLGATRVDTITVTVEPGTFTGTFTPATASPGDTITFTAGGVEFDADTRAFFGSEEAYIASQTATTLEVVVPEDADGEFLLTNLGPDQVASVGTYTAGAPQRLEIVAGQTIAGILDPDDVEDIILVTVPAGATFDVTLSMTGDADVDAYLLQNFVLSACADDFFGCSMATGDSPETVTVTLPAGDYELITDLYDPHGETRVEFVYEFN